MDTVEDGEGIFNWHDDVYSAVVIYLFNSSY